MAENNDAEKTPERRAVQQRWTAQGFVLRYANRRFAPPTDVIELPDRLVVLVEVAGMRGDAFKIALYNRHLVISGYRERPNPSDAAYHQAEINFGEFRVELVLPWAVHEDDVTARYQHGFLRVDLPRQDVGRVRIVDVTTDED